MVSLRKGHPATAPLALNLRWSGDARYGHPGDQTVAGGVLEVVNNDLTWTFTLRQGLKWSDGQPVTADDVTFTLDVVYDTEG